MSDKLNEKKRLEFLESLEIMDTESEPLLNSIVKLASEICDSPVSLISLVDDKRQWFKAKVGLDAEETPKDIAFCTHAIKGDGPFIIEDSDKDERFKDNPLVTSAPFVKFYAGIPLMMEPGINIGTLCVIDHKAKQLPPEKVSQLQALAEQATLIIKNRQSVNAAKKLSTMLETLSKLDLSKDLKLENSLMKYLETGMQMYSLEFGIISKVTGSKYVVAAATSPNMVLNSGDEFLLGETYCSKVIETSKTITYSSVGKIPEMREHPVYLNMKLESYISSPIKVFGEIYGTINFSSRATRKTGFIIEEIKFIEVLSHHIGKVIEAYEEGAQKKYAFEIIERAPGFIGVASPTTQKALFLNSSFHKTIGSKPDDLNISIKDFHPDWALQKISYEAIPHAMEHGQWTGETAILQFDGKEIPVVQTIATHKDSLGQIEFLSTIMQDISTQKQTEQLLKEAKSQALEASQLKSDFLANMSHEIRTPLNGVLGMVSLLEHSKLDENQLDMIQSIKISGRDLMGILNNVLDLSKIEANKVELEEIPFDLPEFLKDLARCHQALALEKGLTIVTRPFTGNQSEYLGDPNRIKQILNNFLSNGIKFTKTGSLSISARTIQTHEGTELIQFRIQDSGIGIPQEKQKVIFEAFSQADNSVTREYGGTGLGLSISTKLAQIMGGELSLESAPQQGSTFILTLPLKTTKSTISQGLVEDKLSILVVDNKPAPLRLTKNFATKLGYAVDTAKDAAQVLSKIAEKNYDLVIMEINMPGLGGIEAAEKIRQKFDEKGPAVILMAEQLGSLNEKPPAELHANAFIDKPFSKMRLEKLIKSLDLKKAC